MKEEDILKIVKDVWNKEIRTENRFHSLGIETVLIGKEEFFKEVSKRLNELFDENDLALC